MNRMSELKKERIRLDYNSLVKVLMETSFNQTKAAVIMGVDRKTVYSILKRHENLVTTENAPA